ncbi:MAG: LPXTG cell wall anchor domain-containing protein [Candidatus Marinimicrobia bacterium]|nr:LPXTG cell wall anchor domain-containing protein [Candidatus Neomarinimicrobiota bacterium]
MLNIFDTNTFIMVLVGLLILLIAAIAFLLRIKRSKTPQETIPGVEEMAKTTFFWANYHRGKISDE